MTKPARGVFRAIASFARYVTPSAPGSLSTSKSGPVSTPASEDVAEIPIHPTENEHTLVRKLSTSTPPQSTPAVSSAEIKIARELTTTSRRQSEDSSLKAMEMEDPSRGSQTDLSCRKPVSSAEHQPVAGSSRTQDSVRLPPSRNATIGDDAGPRFSDGVTDKDSRIGSGMAGYSGVYHGVNVSPDCQFETTISTCFSRSMDT